MTPLQGLFLIDDLHQAWAALKGPAQALWGDMRPDWAKAPPRHGQRFKAL